MGHERTPEEDDRLATFVMLYQEPVGHQTRAASCAGTHTAAREQVDQGTRTDTAREYDDASTFAHATFPATAATQTYTEARESIDSDVSCACSVFQVEALTKTGAREQDDADLRAPFTAIHRGIQTQTDSRDAREHSDTDVSQSIFATFPPQA